MLANAKGNTFPFPCTLSLYPQTVNVHLESTISSTKRIFSSTVSLMKKESSALQNCLRLVSNSFWYFSFALCDISSINSKSSRSARRSANEGNGFHPQICLHTDYKNNAGVYSILNMVLIQAKLSNIQNIT